MPIGIDVYPWYIDGYPNRLLDIHVYTMYIDTRYILWFPMYILCISFVYPTVSFVYPMFSSAFFRLKTVYIHR